MTSITVMLVIFAVKIKAAIMAEQIHSFIKYCQDVPIDKELKIEEYQTKRGGVRFKINMENVAFLLGEPPVSIWSIISSCFSRVRQYSSLKLFLQEAKLRIDQSNAYDRWTDILKNSVLDPDLNLNWIIIQGGASNLEKLLNTSNLSNIIIFGHADEKGWLHSGRDALPISFFDEISSSVRSVGVFSCFSGEVRKRYNFAYLSRSELKRILFFSCCRK